MFYLYLKIHNDTGLRYLGSTRQDPHTYSGSGKYWKNHLKVHGNNVTTTILLRTENKHELRDTGLFFSKLWKIVESSDFANLIEEFGQGGAIACGPNNGMWKIGSKHPQYGKSLSQETKDKISKANRNPSNLTRDRISKSRKGMKLSDPTKKKLSEVMKGIPKPKILCPHCGKEGGIPAMKRFHFEKCKLFSLINDG